MKIVVKTCVFLICITTIVSCENNRLVRLQSHVNEVIAKDQLHGKVSLKMDTIASFEWDSLIFVGPYSNLEKISEKERIDLDKIPKTIEDHDSFMLLVFLHDNKGVKFLELDRTKVLEQLLCDGRGYCIYPKAQSNFIIKN